MFIISQIEKPAFGRNDVTRQSKMLGERRSDGMRPQPWRISDLHPTMSRTPFRDTRDRWKGLPNGVTHAYREFTEFLLSCLLAPS